MKCGTTSLAYILDSHTSIYCDTEGTRFFHSKKYERGVKWYEKKFSNENNRITGDRAEFVTWDSKCSHIPRRIWSCLPNVKMFYIIRHPVRRIESHWAWAVSNGQPWGTINEAVRNENRLIEMSLYWRQISRYREHFPDGQIKILFLEDLKADPRSFFRDCGRFLGVDPDGFDFEEAATPKNQTADKRTDTRLAQRLRQWSGFWTLKEMIPDSIVQLGKRVLRRDGKIEPDWDPDVRRPVEKRLIPDSKKILDYCGRPEDFWSFETARKVTD